MTVRSLLATVWLAGQRNECWRDGGDLLACESKLESGVLTGKISLSQVMNEANLRFRKFVHHLVPPLPPSCQFFGKKLNL